MIDLIIVIVDINPIELILQCSPTPFGETASKQANKSDRCFLSDCQLYLMATFSIFAFFYALGKTSWSIIFWDKLQP